MAHAWGSSASAASWKSDGRCQAPQRSIRRVTTPRRNRVDLHTHTNRSDGVLPPLELYARMREYGMRLVAITDHDSLEGYREIAAAGLGREASPEGPQVIPGLEINTIGGDLTSRDGLGRLGDELHILGFGMDVDDPAFRAVRARQREGRAARITTMLARLREIGMPVDDQMEGNTATDAMGRPHVARALIRAGYATSVEDAFERYLNWGRPAYVPRQGIGPEEAIRAINGAGGIASLAHSPAAPDRPELIDELQAAGLGALEVYYRSFVPETVRRMRAFAAARGLVATGGSDYHGDTMSYAAAQATTSVPMAAGEALLAAIAQRQAARSAPATAGTSAA
jgi:3',5'-nucleoside bisphosphate phosphatase